MGVTDIKLKETCAETHHQMLKAYSFKSNSRQAAVTLLQMNTESSEYRSEGGRQPCSYWISPEQL